MFEIKSSGEKQQKVEAKRAIIYGKRNKKEERKKYDYQEAKEQNLILRK